MFTGFSGATDKMLVNYITYARIQMITYCEQSWPIWCVCMCMCMCTVHSNTGVSASMSMFWLIYIFLYLIRKKPNIEIISYMIFFLYFKSNCNHNYHFNHIIRFSSRIVFSKWTKMLLYCFFFAYSAFRFDFFFFDFICLISVILPN